MTAFSFAAVLGLAEFGTRLLAEEKAIDAGRWPRTEIAAKVDDLTDYLDEEREIDVAFVGSSMMAAAIDPNLFTRETGLESYNAAFAGPSTRTVAVWTRDIVTPLVSPETIVIGIQTREMNDNGKKNQRMHENFLASPGYKQVTAGIASRVEGVLEKYSAFLKYRRAFRHPTSLVKEQKDADEIESRVELGPRGVRVVEPNEYHGGPGFAEKLHERTLTDFALGGPEYESLLDLQAHAAEGGQRLLVVNMPVSSHYFMAHENREQELRSYRELLEEFVSETGGTVIDAAYLFESNRPYRDPLHLDVDGTRVLTEALAARWEDIANARGSILELSCERVAEESCRMTTAFRASGT